MSDRQALWSDDRIEQTTFELSERIRVQAYGGGEREIKIALTKMRDEYEAKLAESQTQPTYEPVTIDEKPNFISRAQFRGIEAVDLCLCRRIEPQETK